MVSWGWQFITVHDGELTGLEVEVPPSLHAAAQACKKLAHSNAFAACTHSWARSCMLMHAQV